MLLLISCKSREFDCTLLPSLFMKTTTGIIALLEKLITTCYNGETKEMKKSHSHDDFEKQVSNGAQLPNCGILLRRCLKVYREPCGSCGTVFRYGTATQRSDERIAEAITSGGGFSCSSSSFWVSWSLVSCSSWAFASSRACWSGSSACASGPEPK